jgi:hypothetical protein
MKTIYGTVENGLTLNQYSRIVDFVEKNIFDGCGGRKIRAIHLIETGTLFRRGNVSSIRSRSYIFMNRYRLPPITNIDMIVENITKATKGNEVFAEWIQNPITLKFVLRQLISK